MIKFNGWRFSYLVLCNFILFFRLVSVASDLLTLLTRSLQV